MEIMMPVHPDIDFDFNSARASLRATAPSSPQGFGDYYLSAPPSPSHLSQLYRDFDDYLVLDNHHHNGKSNGGEDLDFAFHVGELECDETASVSAEELFDGGVMKPFKALPKKVAEAKSSRQSSRNDNSGRKSPGRERGRERVSPGLHSSSRRSARSLSPLRVSQYPWEQEDEQRQKQQQSKPGHSASSSSSSSKGLIKKWRLKDFFLLRSASEGRASDKDHLKKYTAAVHVANRGSSFRGNDQGRSSNGTVSRRRRSSGQVISAHELHYTFNKAVSEDLKKRTFLPYKQGILGKLAFNPAVHALANGFGFSRK